MSNPLDRLRNALAGRYRIERELGAGGMAHVYVAHDERHRRQVAIKVLRPDLTETLGVERFQREIETAANLRHPHILPLFDSGEADGHLYYVMPLVEGESLRDRLKREGRLTLDDAIRIAEQVADALQYAHGRGVIHRDIKPENILLDGYSPAAGPTDRWHAVVADFGIARVARRVDVPSLTQTGSSLGTPRYMSPEQTDGTGEIDGRADLYSLACTVFEMLAGQPPFTGPTFERLIAQHLLETPPPVTRFRTEVPASVVAALARGLSKQPSDRFPTTAAFAAALRAPTAETGVARSVAVLPFVSFSADPENEYFADGITEDVIAHLSAIRALKVVSRTSVMAFRNRDRDLREIAARLQVETLLEGSVRRAGNRVRIVAQLVDAARDRHLWAATFDRDLTDIFAIQTEVAEQIAGALEARLTPEERVRIHRKPTVDLQAYALYLQGRGQILRYTTEGFRQGLALYQRATERDPSYALAYTGIAQAYTELGETGEMAPDEAYPQAKAAAERAIALDPELADAHCMAAYVKMTYEFDWAGAEAAFRRALDLNPNSADVADLYGRLCAALERFDEAIALQTRANELDPIVNKVDVATAYLRAGRHAEAAEYARRAVEVDRADPRSNFTLGWALLGMGRQEEGLDAMRQAVSLAPGNNLWLAQLGEAYALSGMRDEAEAALRELENRARTGYVSPYHLAYVYTGLGRYDDAMDCLERAEAQRSGSIYGIKGSFLFRPLHAHPRFQAMLSRMRLA